MKHIVITKAGGPEVLQVQEIDTPQPKSGEVQIAVRAAGINFADILARKGMYPDAPKIPCVVGYEVSGIVTAALGSRRWISSNILAPWPSVRPAPASMSFCANAVTMRSSIIARKIGLPRS